jgi:hypothetical protein
MPGAPAPDLRAALRADLDDELLWLNVARWFRDHGRDDETAAVSVFWPTLPDSLAVRRSIDLVLADVRQTPLASSPFVPERNGLTRYRHDAA